MRGRSQRTDRYLRADREFSRVSRTRRANRGGVSAWPTYREIVCRSIHARMRTPSRDAGISLSRYFLLRFSRRARGIASRVYVSGRPIYIHVRRAKENRRGETQLHVETSRTVDSRYRSRISVTLARINVDTRTK